MAELTAEQKLFQELFMVDAGDAQARWRDPDDSREILARALRDAEAAQRERLMKEVCSECQKVL